MTVLAEVKVVTADECGCSFAKYPIAHDRLLSIEGLGVPWAASIVVDLISGIDPGTGDEGQIFRDPDDFGRFVAQHNWVDPVGMAELAGGADFAMSQAWSGERTRGEPTG
jgi:hypothetical protein